MDVVPHDEEVVVETALVNDTEFIVQSFCDFRCYFIILSLDFFPSDVVEVLLCIPIPHILVGVFRDIVFACVNNIVVAVNLVCDFNGAFKGFRTPFKQLAHLVVVLEIETVVFKSCLVDFVLFTTKVDALHCILNVSVRLFNVVDVVGCNDFDANVLCKLVKKWQHFLFFGDCVVLKFNVEVAVLKHCFHSEGVVFCSLIVAVKKMTRDCPCKTSGATNEAFAMFCKKVKVNTRFAIKSVHKRGGGQLHQVFITRHVFGKEDKVIVFVEHVRIFDVHIVRNVKLTADDRLDSVFAHCFNKNVHAIHIAVVGDCDSVHTLCFDCLCKGICGH